MSHYRLFIRLIKAGLPKCITDLLVYWYSKLTYAVKWNTCISRWSIVRQGGVLLFYLLSLPRRACGIGCNISDVYGLHRVVYAGDIIRPQRSTT